MNDFRFAFRQLLKHPDFTVVAVLACLVPARRATSVDPTTALRSE